MEKTIAAFRLAIYVGARRSHACSGMCVGRLQRASIALHHVHISVHCDMIEAKCRSKPKIDTSRPAHTSYM